MKPLLFSVLLSVMWTQSHCTNQTDSNDVLGDAAGEHTGCWEQFNGRSFRFVKSSVSWTTAQKHCLDLGGNLATIRDAVEEEYVKNKAKGQTAWVGLSDAQKNTKWFWISSKALTYTNWCPGEPNNYKGNQDCVVINFSDKKCWDDQRCVEDKHPFVCERKS